MKNNELMIHNYVSFDNFPVEITNIGLTHIEGYLNKYDKPYRVRRNLGHINPIPITEEVLAKNGFKREYDCICEYTYYIREIDGYFVEVKIGCSNMGDEYVNCHIDNCDRNSVANADIRYLHQLQNLLNIVGVEMKWKV